MNRKPLFYITAILLCFGILSCNKKESIATCNYEVVPLPKSITPAKEAPFIHLPISDIRKETRS